MIELAFLVGFTLHNLEEALWLPGWSTRAGRFGSPVGAAEFRFAVSVVTALGYALTACYFAFGANAAVAGPAGAAGCAALAGCAAVVRYAYLGFVGMMALNAAFPHLVATIALRRYAPGLLTGLLFDLPAGGYILFAAYRAAVNPVGIVLAVIVVSGVVIASLKPLFAAGAALSARARAGMHTDRDARRNEGIE